MRKLRELPIKTPSRASGPNSKASAVPSPSRSPDRISFYGFLTTSPNAVVEPYRCGAKAANDLDGLIGGRAVDCIPIALDRYGRTVASCAVGGADLADWLVRQGLALDWPRTTQEQARRDEGGIWAGSVVEPWRFREDMRPSGRSAECSPIA